VQRIVVPEGLHEREKAETAGSIPVPIEKPTADLATSASLERVLEYSFIITAS
jgi:hypothetical protein